MCSQHVFAIVSCQSIDNPIVFSKDPHQDIHLKKIKIWLTLLWGPVEARNIYHGCVLYANQSAKSIFLFPTILQNRCKILEKNDMTKMMLPYDWCCKNPHTSPTWIFVKNFSYCQYHQSVWEHKITHWTYLSWCSNEVDYRVDIACKEPWYGL